jgi:hypothetical protein
MPHSTYKFKYRAKFGGAPVALSLLPKETGQAPARTARFNMTETDEGKGTVSMEAGILLTELTYFQLLGAQQTLDVQGDQPFSTRITGNDGL